MRRITLLLRLAGATAALAACHDSDGGGATSFDATVTNQIQGRTNETAAPIEVNGTTFVFPTSPDAFDDVLPADGGPVVPQ